MTISEAVASRRSIRAFLDKPVDRAIIERVLAKAQRAPSGGNTQPWHGVVLTGPPMEALFDRVARDLPRGREAFAPEYHVYPSRWVSPPASRLAVLRRRPATDRRADAEP